MLTLHEKFYYLRLPLSGLFRGNRVSLVDIGSADTIHSQQVQDFRSPLRLETGNENWGGHTLTCHPLQTHTSQRLLLGRNEGTLSYRVGEVTGVDNVKKSRRREKMGDLRLILTRSPTSVIRQKIVLFIRSGYLCDGETCLLYSMLIPEF